jgi:lipoyl(octanoyl) transferase
VGSVPASAPARVVGPRNSASSEALPDDETTSDQRSGADDAATLPSSLFPLPFRLIDTPPAPGPWNMAVDAALAESVRGGGAPVLRFYRWSPRCLSLGRNQPAAGHYRREELERRGIGVVRRPTGGRAVLHDRELTYSVVVGEAALGGPRATYAAVSRALVAGLRRLGVPAGLQPRPGRAAVPSLAPCFREPAEGEVVVAGRKLVGSAQVRERGVLLQHGSLLLADDQSEVAALLARPSAVRDEPPAVLAEFLAEPPSWERLTAALADGWREALGGELRSGALTPAELRSASAYERRYADVAWTWRR